MQNRRVAFLGIDIGTTAVKAVLVDIEGKIFAECDIEQTVLRSNIVWVEQDPVTVSYTHLTLPTIYSV